MAPLRLGPVSLAEKLIGDIQVTNYINTRRWIIVPKAVGTGNPSQRLIKFVAEADQKVYLLSQLVNFIITLIMFLVKTIIKHSFRYSTMGLLFEGHFHSSKESSLEAFALKEG